MRGPYSPLATFSDFDIYSRVRTSPSDHEKYAIIGIGCRMPPAANSLEAFWKFLLRGGNALKPVRKDRWDQRQYFDEDPNRPGKSYAPKFAMLEADVKLFDPLAFGISPREAACMDPQQRLLLEVTWEAFEDAGVPLGNVAGTRTGVFIGGFCMDHLLHQMQPSNRHLIQAHSPVGASVTLLSNRLSHAFDLRGPSLTMDTACSSSLVAIHYACQSLHHGDSDMVIAGGVNVMMRPDFPIMMSKGHFLSDHGECHTFDVSASGYARGEGAGVFLIRRLDDALADGDPIHAVIRGTGVNQDGHTDGISLPNSEAQEDLARGVYRQAGLVPGEVDYVEAHGTGTQAGDSAETRALNAVFSEGRTRKLPVGSVKTNIGHLEAAAGVAGMLKTIGAVKFRQVPRNLHFENPNPKIPFEDYCLQVVQETMPLPSEAEKPTVYAAVNSFGYGGTNAHVILESPPPVRPSSATEPSVRPFLVPLSACSEKALRDLAAKFAFQAGKETPGAIADLIHTTAFHRSHLRSRCAAVADSSSALREQWIAVSTGQAHEGLVTGSVSGEMGSGLVFVYTGMGPQWWGMGRELIRTEPVFASAVDEIDRHFKSLSGWSLREAMMAGEQDSKMERTEVAQPANFAIQVALTRLWESLGVRPSAVVGHSVGEVVSAYVAGVYSLEDAVRVSYHRSRLQQTMAGRGAMLAVGLPEAEALKWIADSPGVSVAAVNSFGAVTLSGDADQLHAIAAGLEKAEIFQKFLRVEVAYHSPQMDPLHDELMGSLAGLTPREAAIPLYSTACGLRIPAADWGADYWWRNVRQPVHFAAAMQALFADGFVHFLEIGPHPVLGNSIKECAASLEKKVACFVSLRRKEPEIRQILVTAGSLYCTGYDLDWTALAPANGQLVPTPKYPWQRELHWIESDRSRMERLGLPGPVYLNRTLLGGTPSWEVEINRQYFPFLMDHGVQDQTVFPGMGYMEAALALAARAYGQPAVLFESVSFEKVLVVDVSKLQYLITEWDVEGSQFRISSRVEGDEESVQRHCRGRMFPLSESSVPQCDLSFFEGACSERVPIPAFYERLQERGLFYGPSFRPTSEILVGDGCFLLKIRTGGSADGHPLHPSLFDAALQAVLYCSEGDRLFVPFSFERFEYYSRPEAEECLAVGRILSQSETLVVADVWLTNSAGEVHACARRISCQVIETGSEKAGENLLYAPVWEPAPHGEIDGSRDSACTVIADAKGQDIPLAEALVARIPGSALRLIAYSSGTDFRPCLDGATGRLLLFVGRETSGESGWRAACEVSERVVAFLQAAGELAGEQDVTLVTRGASAEESETANLSASAVASLGLVAQNEFEHLRCRSIDIPGDSGAEAVEWLVAEIFARSRGDIAIRGGQRFENRLRPIAEKKEEGSTVSIPVDEPLVLRAGTKGKTLHFRRFERRIPSSGEVEIRVHAAHVGHRDLLKWEGRLHTLDLDGTFSGGRFGTECAGVVVRTAPGGELQAGDRVVSLVLDGFGTYATASEQFSLKLPDKLGYEAAGIPLAFLAAYRGLVQIARLHGGERVLIHHGSGELGMAALQIAKWIGAEIFTTAGSEETCRFLGEFGNVYSSRTLDFVQQIREATRDEGVDVVLGEVNGQAMHAGLNLLRSGGRYIALGNSDMASDHALPMRAFQRNLLFASIDLERLMVEAPAVVRSTLETVLSHFEKGDFQPGPSRLFPAASVQQAFEDLAAGEHPGQILLDFSQGPVDVVEHVAAPVKADGCYIVTGGTSGFGAMTAIWLAAGGAGKVVIVSRSGPKAPGAEETLCAIRAHGAEAEVLSVDVSDPGQVRDLVARSSGGSYLLRGVIHGAMVLDDARMADLTPERFRKVFIPKLAGAWNFSEALRTCPTLEFLVFYSSISALVGNRGQTNYVAANSCMDALAKELRSQKMPAYSINWGALAEAGVVARDERLGTVLSSAGITGLTNDQAFGVLDTTLRSSRPQTGAFLVDWQKWHESHPKLEKDPRFRDLLQDSGRDGGNPAIKAVRLEMEGLSKEQRLVALELRLQGVLARTLKMSQESVSSDRKLNEMGVDSLMVLELGLGIKEELGISFTAMEFLKGPNLRQLASLAEQKVWKSPA